MGMNNPREWNRPGANKGSTYYVGKGFQFTGWMLFIMGIFYILAGGFGPENSFGSKISSMLIFFGGGLFFMILQGRKNRKAAKKFEEQRNQAVINGQQIVNTLDREDMEDVSEIVSRSLDMVKEHMPEMMERGSFTRTYSSHSSQINAEISFSSEESNFHIHNGVPINKSIPVDVPVQKKREPVVVACKGCGANNKVLQGSVGECEFCGSPISAD